MVKKVAKCNSTVASPLRVGPIEFSDPRVLTIDNKVAAITDMVKILRLEREKLTCQKQYTKNRNSAEYKYNLQLAREQVEQEILAKVKSDSGAK